MRKTVLKGVGRMARERARGYGHEMAMLAS